MAHALVLCRVGKKELAFYWAIFLLPFFLPMGTPQKFVFSWEDTAFGIISFIAFISGIVIPAVIAKGKLSKKEFVNYFVSLNFPVLLDTL